MQCNGSCSWGVGTQIVFVSGDQLGASQEVEVPVTASGDTANVAVEMTAPSESGTYKGYWKMQDTDGELFGAKVWVQIIVTGTASTE